MTGSRIRSLAGRMYRSIHLAWPQVPLGILLLFTGAVNVSNGLQSQGFSLAYQILAHVIPLSELSQEVSLGMLGSGVQVLLGSGMLVTGAGLFWRLRSAWAYTILFVIIAIAIDLVSRRPMRFILMPALALTALVFWQNRFNRRSLAGSYLMSLIGLLSVFVYGVFGALLLGNRFNPAIHELSTALYFTVVTLSTVGSNIYPAAPEAQIFMVTLILGGISIFTTTIVTTVEPLLSSQINPILTGKRVKMNLGEGVILIGSSGFASGVALEFVRRGVGFVQVVSPGDASPLDEQPVVRGEPVEEVLTQAGIRSAQTVIIADQDDSTNAFALQNVKALNPGARTIVAASSWQALGPLRTAQADLVFAPASVGARVLINLIRGNSLSKELQELFDGEKSRD